MHIIKAKGLLRNQGMEDTQLTQFLHSPPDLVAPGLLDMRVARLERVLVRLGVGVPEFKLPVVIQVLIQLNIGQLQMKGGRRFKGKLPSLVPQAFNLECKV